MANAFTSYLFGDDIVVPRVRQTTLSPVVIGNSGQGSYDLFKPGPIEDSVLRAERRRQAESAAKSSNTPQNNNTYGVRDPRLPGPNQSYGGSGFDTSRGGDPGVYAQAELIMAASEQLGVPPDVIAAIMDIESDGNPKAHSPQDAVGLMQVVPRYHQKRADKYGGDLWDPSINVLTGTDFLRENFDRAKKLYGVSDDQAWTIASAAYLGGWDWDAGTFNSNADHYGSTGQSYSDAFNTNRSKYVALQPSNSPDGNSLKSAIIAYGKDVLGQPYKWGGESFAEGGFDCSGLTQYAYAQAGINIPRTAQDQYNAAQKIPTSQVQPGDLIFFENTFDAPYRITHVGIWLGDGKMLHAPQEGDVTRIIDLNSSEFFKSRIAGFGTFV
jgi:cell wall-associated NlpC family hydrolase